jgi:hypothetical protein
MFVAVTLTHILTYLSCYGYKIQHIKSWLCFQNLAFLTKMSELHVKVLTIDGQLQDADRLLVILGNNQLDALFLNVFILCLYMFRAASAHHQEDQIVLIHYLV